MSHRIWKYPFEIADRFVLQLPQGARVLSVELQDEQPCLWAMVNAESTEELRRFALVGTGHLLPNGISTYIATFQQPPFVWHLFELAAK